MLFDVPLRNLSSRERIKYLWLMRLKTVPQFSELLARLDRGQSLWSTTEWFMAQPNRGELSACSFETARRYLSYLAEALREERKKRPKNVAQFEEAAVRVRMQSNIRATIQELPVKDPTGIEDMTKVITQEVENLDSITILKYCFMVQKERVNELRNLEKTANVPLPVGNDVVDLLRKIGYSIWKIEEGTATLRLKNTWVGSVTGQTERKK